MNSNKLILDGSKILYHPQELQSWLKGDRVAPIVIECAITTVCNYKCVFCSKKFERVEDNSSLSKETIFEFLNDAHDIGVKAISFIGDGENTCNPNLIDAIVHGKRIGLDMALGTNGYLLADDDLERILPCLTYLRFSICAAEDKRYAEIHGCCIDAFSKVRRIIKKAVEIKRKNDLKVTIGLQMVLMPEFADQIIPLAEMGREIGVDYLVIKHCSDDAEGSIGVSYDQYEGLYGLLQKAETYATEQYQVTVKWSKILAGKTRCYSKCYAAPFMVQMSGSGLLAPCGPLFNPKYKQYQLGNIKESRLKALWESDHYWDVMAKLSEGELNPQVDCPYLCLQHNTNTTLWNIKEKNHSISVNENQEIQHINFI